MARQVVLVVRLRLPVGLKTVACPTDRLHQLLPVALAVSCDVVELQHGSAGPTERTLVVELFQELRLLFSRQALSLPPPLYEAVQHLKSHVRKALAPVD